MVRITNLVKRYGNLVALDHLNLEIKEGEIFGLLGPNGSGKTTAINCMLALLKYDKGSIRIMGQDLGSMTHKEIPFYRRKIGVVFQDFRLLKDRNVYENIAFALRVTEAPSRLIKKKVPAAL